MVALENHHALFLPRRPAPILNHKHIQGKAQTFDDALQKLNTKFLFLERREKLIYESNNLEFETFCKEPRNSNHSALKEIFTKASMLQLQQGAYLQDEQHIHDVLINTCEQESLSQRLGTIDITDFSGTQ